MGAGQGFNPPCRAVPAAHLLEVVRAVDRRARTQGLEHVAVAAQQPVDRFGDDSCAYPKSIHGAVSAYLQQMLVGLWAILDPP